MKTLVGYRRLSCCAIALAIVAMSFWHTRPAHAGSCGVCPYVFTTTASNTNGYITTINDSRMNWQPNMVFEVAQTWPNAYDTHPFGVWYNPRLGEWTIFNEDRAAIPLGTSFALSFGWDLGTTNLYFAVFSHTATASNSGGDSTQLDNADLNNNPAAQVFVTQDWTGTYNPHEIGVWYTGSHWAIFNEDGTAIPAGSSFFVSENNAPANNVIMDVASAGNTNAYVTYINNPTFNGNQGAILQVNQVWNATPTCGCIFNNHPIGVWYDASVGEWTIYNVDRTPMPAGATFFVRSDTAGGGV